ncbi:ADP-dependent NAD(P)H-hydrate dehydratase [Rathayibacter soli]|uniref:ADP-dependent NAD(P)H-hydrate dehydratase n=1 Tax=Rathayibacter soli TaxID=3144168 RepID=UPI0027E59F25|nr:ADP/ATP-dependent (S)-NAD(P)H-hydrate dehydratase [Glaciibacter superstes]
MNPPAQNWTRADAREWIAVPAASDDKYSRGVLGLVTGSAQYPGAAVLGADAAVRTGVGMVRYLGDARAADLVLHRRPEVVTGEGRVQAWLLGSGQDAATRTPAEAALLADALGQAVPFVLDAGALDLVAAASGPVIITPHFRELARALAARGIECSTDQIANDPPHWARAASEVLAATVLLKGATTYVAAPNGELLTVSGAPSWLATAGTGDVLAGILGALVATHARNIEEGGHRVLVRLGATAALVHGLAAARASAGGPIAALDVADTVPATIASLLTGGAAQQ